MVQGSLEEMPYHVTLHGRHVIQLDSDWSLKRFEPHVYFLKTLYPDIFQQVCSLRCTKRIRRTLRPSLASKYT